MGGEGGVDGLLRRVELAGGGVQERPAPARGAQRPRPVESGRPVRERSEHPPGLVRPPERDERLHVVRDEPRIARIERPVGRQTRADRPEVAVRGGGVACRQRHEAEERGGETQRDRRTDLERRGRRRGVRRRARRRDAPGARRRARACRSAGSGGSRRPPARPPSAPPRCSAAPRPGRPRGTPARPACTGPGPGAGPGPARRACGPRRAAPPARGRPGPTSTAGSPRRCPESPPAGRSSSTSGRSGPPRAGACAGRGPPRTASRPAWPRSRRSRSGHPWFAR